MAARPVPTNQHHRSQEFQQQSDADREVLHRAEVAELRQSDRNHSVRQHPQRLSAGRQTDSPE